MAIIKRISSKAKPTKVVKYLTQNKKTEERLISGKDCDPSNVVNEFNVTQEIYGKTQGVKYHHVIQSFSPEDNITPEKAHEIGKELAESQFKGHEVFIVTHKDKEHIHNHLVVNSVSFENGKKYEASNKSLWDIKRESNRICEREKLQTIDLNYKARERLTSAELRIELREGTPWKKELKECIDFARNKSNSFDEFTKYLKDNFNINTRITNKNISYQHPDKAKPIRGSKLGASYNKGELVNEFTRKKESINREGERETDSIQGNSRGLSRSTSNVNWSAVRDNVQSEGNRVSKHFSDDVAGKIQRKVRGIKERTERIIENSKSENRESTEKQRDIHESSKSRISDTQKEHGKDVESVKPKINTRDWELDR